MIQELHTGPENSPPLFFVLAWFSAKLGDPSVAIRLPSLVFGAGTLPLLYAVAKETFDVRVGLLGAAVLGLSPFSLYYGIEARPYATMAFFVLLSTWALLRAARTREWRWWLFYGLAAACAAYSHYTSVFALIAQGVWTLWTCRDRVRETRCWQACWLPCCTYHGWRTSAAKFDRSSRSAAPAPRHNVLVDLRHVIPGYPDTTLFSIPTLPRPACIADLRRRGRDLAVTKCLGTSCVARCTSRPPADQDPNPADGTCDTHRTAAVQPGREAICGCARGPYASVPYACLITPPRSRPSREDGESWPPPSRFATLTLDRSAPWTAIRPATIRAGRVVS